MEIERFMFYSIALLCFTSSTGINSLCYNRTHICCFCLRAQNETRLHDETMEPSAISTDVLDDPPSSASSCGFDTSPDMNAEFGEHPVFLNNRYVTKASVVQQQLNYPV